MEEDVDSGTTSPFLFGSGLNAASEHATSPAAMGSKDQCANEAMSRYSAGDAGAFAAVYDELAPRLFRYLLRLTRSNTVLAEDLLQQTFLQMHDARGRFVPGSAVSPWAYAIARRLFIDTVRKGRREELFGSPEDLLTNLASEVVTPEADVAARRIAAELDAELERLPAQQREAFLLVRDEGLSMSEAALLLGTTVAAVKLRASRAYRALRAVLEPQGRLPDEEV